MGQEKKIFTREMLEQMHKAGSLTQDQYQACLRLVEANEEGKPIVEMTSGQSVALRGVWAGNGIDLSSGVDDVPMPSITKLTLRPIIILENHTMEYPKQLLSLMVDNLVQLDYQLLCLELRSGEETSDEGLREIDESYNGATGYADVAGLFKEKGMEIHGIDHHRALSGLKDSANSEIWKTRNVFLAQTIRQMAPKVGGGIVCLLGAAHGKPVYDELKSANQRDGFADECIFVNTYSSAHELPPQTMDFTNKIIADAAKEIMQTIDLETHLKKGESGMALRKAANENLPEYVRKIICEQGSGFINEAGDGTGMTSLHRACKQISSPLDNLDVVTCLLKAGADPTLRDKWERLPVDLIKIGGEDEKRCISDFVYGLAFRRAATVADLSAMEAIVRIYGDAVFQLVGKESQRNALHFVCTKVNKHPKSFGKYRDIIQWLIAASPAMLEQTDVHGKTPVDLLKNGSVLRQFNSQIGSPSEITRSTAAPSPGMG